MTSPRWPLAATLLVLAGCGPDVSPSTTPSPASTASAEATVAPFDPVWRRVDLGAPADVELSGAYAGPSGLVILGGRFAPVGPVGFTWTSRDGSQWQMQATPGLMSPGLGAAIANVEVLVGTGETNRCAHPFGETTWARRDGVGWAAAPFQEAQFCAGGSPEIAAGDASFVVAGSGTGDQPFGWWSVDGLAWHDAPIAIDPFPLIRGLAWDAGKFWIVARDEGGIVAMTSADGQHWTSWSRLVAVPGIEPTALVPHAGRPLLFTQEGGPSSVWEVTAADQATPIQPTGLSDIAGTLLVAVATQAGRVYLSLDAPNGSKLDTSSDGLTWSGVVGPTVPGLRITGIADDGRHLLVVGVVEANASTWSAWIGTSPDAP